MPIAIANRYARALADVVSQKGDYRQVRQVLENFAAVYGESAELREVFDTPALPLTEKLKVLTAIMGKMGTTSITTNFLSVLGQNYRMNLLEEICLAFHKLANDRLGVVEVKVVSAAGLSEAEQQALRAKFIDLTGKEVEFDFHLDRELLGGVLAQIGSTVYDGSVRGQLDRIRERLTEQ